jgi:predicted DNA-binding transcriptional regulator AlpA
MTKLLRLPEVAALTGIPENTLRFWRHQGTGPKSAKLGRRLVYREEDVVAWIDRQFENDRTPAAMLRPISTAGEAP